MFSSSKRAGEAGLSLAEIILAMTILLLFSLAMVLALSRGMRLDDRDAQITRNTMLCSALIEQVERLAASPAGFDRLASQPLRRMDGETEYIYGLRVLDYTPASVPRMTGWGVPRNKDATVLKVTAVLYYQDPGSPGLAPDVRRGRNGEALRISSFVQRPTTSRAGL